MAMLGLQHPAHFQVRPAVGVHQAGAADELAAAFQLQRPHAEAAQLPVAQQHRQRTPGIGAVQRFAVADPARAVRVGQHRGIVVEVPLGECGEAQARRFNGWNIEHHDQRWVAASSSASARVLLARLSCQDNPVIVSPVTESTKSSAWPGGSRCR